MMVRLLRVLVIACYAVIGPAIWLVLYVVTLPMIAKQVWRGRRGAMGKQTPTVMPTSSGAIQPGPPAPAAPPDEHAPTDPERLSPEEWATIPVLDMRKWGTS